MVTPPDLARLEALAQATQEPCRHAQCFYWETCNHAPCPHCDAWHDLAKASLPALPWLITQAREAERLVKSLELTRDAFKEYQHRAQLEHSQTKAQLRAYTETVVMGPHNWRALQDADPVPMPTPEGLDKILDERDALRTRLAEVERLNQTLTAALEKIAHASYGSRWMANAAKAALDQARGGA